MLLTITTTHQPATDLGYLLHKNPERMQSFALNFGQAHVFYPEASAERCTATLLVDVDPVGLVRRSGPAGGQALEQYVNDRPYVASSFLSVAIASVFGSALGGRSRERPELAETAIPLTARLPVVPSRGGPEVVRRLFEPLGYTLALERAMRDEAFPQWGPSPYVDLTVEGVVRLRDLLAHLYVLIPVLDDDKHYWIGDDEVEKLLRHGAGWLAGHPERELISRRYLKHQRRLTEAALARLLADEDPDPDREAAEQAAVEAAVEAPLRLNAQRLDAVAAELAASGARRVLDLGCGEGRLLARLLVNPQFEAITGVDISHRALERAAERLHLDRLPPSRRQAVQLLQGALTYRDARLAGYDAAAVVEVVEHLDPARLATFEQALFGATRPGTVVVTTPNIEYNVNFAGLAAGRFRHGDHRFEWTRAEFAGWAGRVAERYGYQVRLAGIGPADPQWGEPTQIAVFTRAGGEHG
jgi:3' terminal RNA ribose 2'-O-methyltransferase Hen1